MPPIYPLGLRRRRRGDKLATFEFPFESWYRVRVSGSERNDFPPHLFYPSSSVREFEKNKACSKALFEATVMQESSLSDG